MPPPSGAGGAHRAEGTLRRLYGPCHKTKGNAHPMEISIHVVQRLGIAPLEWSVLLSAKSSPKRFNLVFELVYPALLVQTYGTIIQSHDKSHPSLKAI